MERTILSFLVAAFVMLVSGHVSGQIHLIAGYDLSYIKNTAMNSIIADANSGQEKEPSLYLKDVRYLNGFVVGGRYASDLAAFELTYAKRFTRRIGDNYTFEIRDMNDSLLDKTTTDIDLYYDIQTISAGMEFGRIIRIGGSIDYNIYTNEVLYLDVNDPRDFKTRSQTWGSKVFIGANLAPESVVNFSVRLYYQWLWGYNDVSEFENKFLGTDCTYCRERPYSFGFTFLINNMLPFK